MESKTRTKTKCKQIRSKSPSCITNWWCVDLKVFIIISEIKPNKNTVNYDNVIFVVILLMFVDILLSTNSQINCNKNTVNYSNLIFVVILVTFVKESVVVC